MSTYRPAEQITWNPFVTYRALDTTGNLVVVKRFTITYSSPVDDIDARSSVEPLLPELGSFAAFASGDGIAPWLRVEDTGNKLYFVRPFYEGRLIDNLSLEPTEPPSKRLLTVFGSLAQGFDQLKHYYPSLSFFIYPDDIYLTGESAVVANWGLDSLRSLLGKGWHGGWVGKSGSLEAASCYPQAEGCHIMPRVLVTPPKISPVFALATLYVFFRTGHGPFLTEAAPATLSSSARHEFWQTYSTAQAYLNDGVISLSDIPDEPERRILTQALIPDSQVSSCTALIDELGRRFGVI